MALFQGKIGWKIPRNRELSFCSVPTRRAIVNSKKKPKNQKKYHYGFVSKQNRLQKGEKERK